MAGESRWGYSDEAVTAANKAVDWLIAHPDMTMGATYHDSGSCWVLIDAFRDRLTKAEARVRELEAELLRVRTTGHGAAHELDCIAVEAGLGHSPRPGVVAAYTRALRQQIEAFGVSAGGEPGREITAAVLANIRELALRSEPPAQADEDDGA